MKQKEINNERYSQEEIDAIIDEIIEKEPVKEIKEHLIKYEKECREKKKTTKSILKEEKCEYEINHPHDKAVRLMLANSQEAANLINLALKKEDLIKSSQIEQYKSMLKEEKCEHEINHPHDKAVRLMLANSQEAANLINLALKKEDLIKSSQIEQYKSSFVTKLYKNKESDIVYKDLKNKGIYYLIEHQSKQDKMMPVRIAEYSIEIMRDALDLTKKEKKCEIPRVIAIVLYTGEGKWQVSQTLEEIQAKIEGIEATSVGSYSIVDINTYTDEELLKAKGALPKMLLMEKNIKNLTDEAKKIEDCNFTEEERERISIYITNVIREVNYDLAEKLLEKINIEEGKNMRLGQALVDYWYDGVAKGEEKRKKRRQKRRKKRGLCFWKA